MRISDWSSDVCSSDLVKNREQYAFGQGHQRGGLDPGRDEKVAASRGGQMPHDFARAETIAVGLDSCAARRAAALSSEQRRVGKEWVMTFRLRWWRIMIKKQKKITQEQIKQKHT